MPEAVIVDAVRTPIGRAAKGSLKSVRADDLAAIPLRALIERNPQVDTKSMLDVIRMHRDSLRPIKEENVQPSLLRAAQDSWDKALELGEKFGYKNSQVSVLAPTGTSRATIDGH